MSEIGLAPKQSRTAFRAETAHIVAQHFAGCAELLRRAPGNFERVGRDIENRSVPSAGGFLAIAAMTIERHNWFRCNFVTNRAAGAATSNWFHIVSLELMKIFFEQRPIIFFPALREVIVQAFWKTDVFEDDARS